MSWLRHVTLFMLAGALAFSVFVPRSASAFVRTVSAAGCKTRQDATLNGHWLFNALCSIPAGTDMPSDKLQTAYFDYWTNSTRDVYLELTKQSYNGTQYLDYQWVTTGAGTAYSDTALTLVNVKANPAVWDYLFGKIWNVDDVVGFIVTRQD
jgi:hypothetical protein